jgi:DNA transformation protein
MSYWRAPDEALDGPDAMRPWATLALAAARRASDARRSAKRKPRRPPGKSE